MKTTLTLAIAALALGGFATGAQAGAMDNNFEGVASYTPFVGSMAKSASAIKPAAGGAMSQGTHEDSSRYNQG